MILSICLSFSSLFPGGIINSSTFLGFLSIPRFCHRLNYLLCPQFYFLNIHQVYELFLEADITASSPMSNNYCFLYFLLNDKNPYSLNYSLFLGSIE